MKNTTWLPIIDHQRCTDCGICVGVCPTHVLKHVEDRVEIVDPDACTYCGQCESLCPANALVLPYQIVLEKSSSTSVR